MENLLIFFALPLATIIISIALQKILKCPILVAGIIFSIFLIASLALGNLAFLIPTIIYTIISYIVAIIICMITNMQRNGHSICSCCNNIHRNCCNENNTNNLATTRINGVINLSNNEQVTENECNNNEQITTQVNIIPNNNTNGRTGCICGRYRRR